MAGGTWTTQNKVRPGVYIRFRSENQQGLTIGERGTVAICEPMSWGPVAQVMTVEAGADVTPFCGYDITSPQALFLRQIFLGTNRTDGAQKVLLYRPPASGSAAATATVGALTATANYPGARGNNIALIVTEDPDEEDTFTVSTVVDGEIADQQTAQTADTLTANDWVTFSGTGALTATTATALTGGADGTVQAAAYSDFLTAIEPYQFDILIYDGTDATVQSAMVSFVQRLCDDNGQYCQLVAAGLTAADSRYVINVASGVTLEDGTTLTPGQVCWWVGGAEAGASYSESLTYAAYPGAVAVSPVLANSQIVAGIQAGKLLLTADYGTVRIETDINSLTTYTTEIGREFRKNKVIRICNTIANDIYRQFSQSYIGVVNNNEVGRGLFKAAIVGYLLELQAQQAIQNFTADDVEVLPGNDIDAIVVNVAIQVVDAVEKIYMTISIS